MSTQINGTMKTYNDSLSFPLPSIHNSFNILYLNVYSLFPKINLDSFSRLDHGFACFMLLGRFWLFGFAIYQQEDRNFKTFRYKS